MLKTLPLKSIILFALIASVIYMIFIGIFLSQRSYTALWILYVGNVAFAICIGIFLYLFKTNRNMKLPITRMIVSGHLVTIGGILITCVIVFLASIIFPTWFHSYNGILSTFRDAAAQMEGRGGNYLLPIFMNAVVGNISTGSFFSIILPFGLNAKKKGNKTKS